MQRYATPEAEFDQFFCRLHIRGSKRLVAFQVGNIGGIVYDCIGFLKDCVCKLLWQSKARKFQVSLVHGHFVKIEKMSFVVELPHRDTMDVDNAFVLH